jgi:large subunit ribosomal protein L30e
MAKKKVVNVDIEELRKIIKDKEVVFGTDRTISLIREGRAANVFVSSTCPEDIRADIKHYEGISKFKVTYLDITNEELGIICLKPYPVSILCEVKE